MPPSPQVQSLDEILASIQPGYQQQENAYQQQINAIPGQSNAAIAGLNVAKANSFRDINSNANSKGMAFSGMPIEQQTRYVGEKYLPGLQNIQNSADNRQFTLQQTLAGLGTEKRNFAMSTQSGQKKSLNDYQVHEADFNRQMAAADLQYQREMQKLQQNQAFSASQGAADRAAKYGTNTADIVRADVSGTVASLSKVVGQDGKVSPQDYLRAKAAWVSLGHAAGDFDKNFSNYANNSHSWDYGIGSRPAAKTAPAPVRYGTLSNHPTF